MYEGNLIKGGGLAAKVTLGETSKREPEMRRIIQRYQELVKRLDDRVSILEGRTHCIRRPDPSNLVKQDVPSGVTEIGSAFLVSAAEIDRITDRINEVIDTLEI